MCEGVNATSELPSHLRVKRGNLRTHPYKSTTFCLTKHIQCGQGTHPRTHTHTCSLVVLPLATRTMWNPVSPATGTKNKPATHITAILSSALRIPKNNDVYSWDYMHIWVHYVREGYVTIEQTWSSCLVWWRMYSRLKPNTFIMWIVSENRNRKK